MGSLQSAVENVCAIRYMKVICQDLLNGSKEFFRTFQKCQETRHIQRNNPTCLKIIFNYLPNIFVHFLSGSLFAKLAEVRFMELLKTDCSLDILQDSL